MDFVTIAMKIIRECVCRALPEGKSATTSIKAQSSNECFRADKLRLNGLFIAEGKERSLYGAL